MDNNTSRMEQYLAYLVDDTNDFNALPNPISRGDVYLYRLCEMKGGGGGGLTPPVTWAALAGVTTEETE